MNGRHGFFSSAAAWKREGEKGKKRERKGGRKHTQEGKGKDEGKTSVERLMESREI